MTPDEALARLAGSTAPFLLGVRHHSPACAAAVPKLLDAYRPTRVLVELPAELTRFAAWLGHAELEAPVALAAVRDDGASLFFYPFADFSPELAAIRWAVAAGVPVEACDRPYLDRTGEVPADADADDGKTPDDEVEGRLVPAWLAAVGVEDTEELWDVLVESRARADDPEAIRRAALAFGWALREDAHAAGGVPADDRRREAFMRAFVARTKGERVAAVVGAFHAAALVDPPLRPEDVAAALPSLPTTFSESGMVASLVPYAFDLLDSRSGYPAGIRDPEWQARAHDALVAGQGLDDAIAAAIVSVVREVRTLGHVAGVPDAQEAVRMALDLSRLRGLPSPGRREMIESIESCLAQGERLGRGRVLARAMERVLVGSRRGKLPADVPRTGLAPHVEALLRELGLPGPGQKKDDPARLTLDPLRSDLDRRRHVALQRLAACDVPYATLEDRASPTSAELLTRRWSIQWVPATDALLELVGLRGVTLAQAAEGALRAEEKRLRDADGLTPAARIEGVAAAAECGLVALVAERFSALGPALREGGGLAEVVSALTLVERIAQGHVPGVAIEVAAGALVVPEGLGSGELLAIAVAALEGLAGADRPEDALALRELVDLALRGRADVGALGEGRLGWVLDRIAREGSPMMQGAAEAARVLLGRGDGTTLGGVLGAYVDAAVDTEARNALAARLRGTLLMATPLFAGHPAVFEALVERIDALSDEGFLARLPALRQGCDVLSPAERDRLLEVVAARFGEGPLSWPSGALELELSPELLAAHTAADLEAGAALDALGLAPERVPRATGDPPHRLPRKDHVVATHDRFRLLFGRERERLPRTAARYAAALDELYGCGRGEGSRGGGAGADRSAPFPTVREWGEELADLFGTAVREEVLGRAAAQGRAAAALELDPDAVAPSIELLEQVLSLKGGLAERDLARLRRLVQRIVDQLVEALARRVRPALAGLVTPQASRRKVGPLDLRRTLEENLHTAREEGGVTRLAPDRLYFRRRARRALDWHVLLVVDVSGSMEASVIYSAMMAAILSGLPAVTVRFVAFNTEVLDLSERVDDPLGLLLEIQIGGGTLIGKGLRYARSLVRVPARTLLLVVSDFDEGGPVPVLLSEVRSLVESGVKALGLAALDDRGAPRYHRGIAEQLVDAGMPVAALTPLELARWVGEQIR